jgi:hypothetical protein
LPALSVHVPVADWFEPSVETVWLVVPLAAPESASEQLQLTVTSVLFQPLPFAAGVRLVKAIVGAVASRLMVTDWLFVPPELVAEHVNVVPLVSLETVVGVQPDDEVMLESGSVTVQLTVTLLVYQPLFPSVPETFGVMTGGVESAALKCA